MVINQLNIKPTGGNFNLVMILSTLIIAPSFGIGSSIFGHKTVQTTGKEIVEFGPLSATIISLLTASLLLLASLTKGIPTSLVQLNMASILALGIVKKGWREIFRKNVVKKFWVVWVVAPVFSLLFSLLLTYLADMLGILHK